jgi:hypothetical protein
VFDLAEVETATEADAGGARREGASRAVRRTAARGGADRALAAAITRCLRGMPTASRRVLVRFRVGPGGAATYAGASPEPPRPTAQCLARATRGHRIAGAPARGAQVVSRAYSVPR